MNNYKISTVLGKQYCSDVVNDSTLHTPWIMSKFRWTKGDRQNDESNMYTP